MKKGLVISGGGSKGSFAGGIIEYLIKEEKIDWDVLVGTSTGSILVPLTSVNQIDKLKEQYTNISNKDIFSLDPFNKKGKLKIFNFIWRFINRKSSIGEIKNLEKRLKKYYTKKDYDKSIKNNKDVFVTTTDVTNNKIKYFHQKEEDYDSFRNYIIASASIPLIFPIKRIKDIDYLDGGILEPIPIQKAIDEGCDEIDIIILSSEKEKKRKKMNNMISVVKNTIQLMNIEINRNDVKIGNLKGEKNKIKLNVYRTPVKLTNNSAIFNKEEMKKWWEEGYLFAKNKNFEKLELTKTKTNPNYKIKKLRRKQ
jgi:NTE family protein